MSRIEATKPVSASRSSMVTGLTFVGIAVLNFAYANAMAWLLPVQAFGLLGLVQSCIMVVATLVRSGFPWGLVRVLARAHSAREAYQAAKSAMLGNGLIALAFSLLLAAAVGLAGFDLGPGSGLLLAFIVGEAFLLAATSLLGGVLQSRMQFGLLGLGQGLEAAVKLAAGIVLVVLGYGVVGASATIVLGTAALLALLIWSTRRFTFWRERSWGPWHTYRDSLTIFLGLCALTIISSFDTIGLKLFSHPGQADMLMGYYQAAIILPRVPVLLAGAYATALFPYIARSDRETSAAYISQALKYGLLLILPANLLLVAIPEPIIRLIYPEAYVVSAPALRIAAAGSSLLALATILVSVFQARGMARVPALWLPVAAVAEVAALWLLVPGHTIVGSALALLIASGVACACLWAALLRHYPMRVTLGGALRYLVAGGALVAAAMALPHGNRLWTLASGALALLVYVVLLALARLIGPADLDVLTAGLPKDRVAPVAALFRRCAGIIDRLNRVFPVPGSV